MSDCKIIANEKGERILIDLNSYIEIPSNMKKDNFLPETPKPTQAFSVFRKLFKKKAKTKEFVIAFQIDQAHAELVGTLCVDDKGKVKFLPLKGGSMQTTPNVATFLQVGLKY